MELPPPCPWWKRILHDRQRRIDLAIMWVSLYSRAETVAEARLAWDVFTTQEGQEHWRCPCGAHLGELFKVMVFKTTDAA